MSLAGQLDWVAKCRLLDGYRERHGLDWDDARLAAMDLQYHDLRPERVAGRPRSGSSGSPPTTRSSAAMTEPPTDTRAYFRGRCLQRWADDIVAANWDSLVFDVGGDPLRRVPMMEPLTWNRGPRRYVVGRVRDPGRAARAARAHERDSEVS